MVAFVCERFGGIHQTPRSASARRIKHVGLYLRVAYSHAGRAGFGGGATC